MSYVEADDEADLDVLQDALLSMIGLETPERRERAKTTSYAEPRPGATTTFVLDIEGKHLSLELPHLPPQAKRGQVASRGGNKWLNLSDRNRNPPGQGGWREIKED